MQTLIRIDRLKSCKGISFVITVLVTGCGGAIGLGAIKALRMGSMKLRLIGSDADPYAAIFYMKNTLLDKTCHLPDSDHPNYIPEVINLCRKENVDVIFPCTDAELEKLAISKNDFTDRGTKIIISSPETIGICRDKWLTYNHLGKFLPIVKSALLDIGIKQALQFTGLPAVIKPRVGWGSKQTYKVRNAEEAQIFMKDISKPVVQTWLEGEDYTVDCIADRNGKAISVVPRRRIKIFSGLSFEGITVRDQKLMEIGKKIAKCLRFYGPFNFQAKKVDGEPKIFEINPRFSGTGILTVKAGVNIPLLAVKETCNIKIPTNIDFEEGIILSRYFDEVTFKLPKGES